MDGHATRTLSPDFVLHDPGPPIRTLDHEGQWLTITWDDGLTGRFNRFWLRENDVRPGVIDPVTRERDLGVDAFPDDLALTAAIETAGAIAIDWAPDGHQSRHDIGWLRSTARGTWRPDAAIPDVQTWDAAAMPEPPSFDGPAVLGDDIALQDWLNALATYGFARLRNLPTDDGTVLTVAHRIGTVRASNFGYTFKVQTKPDPDSVAYTSAGLPGHTDLASREVQPGLQLLHCQENGCEGGASTMVDGFRLAEHLRDTDPKAFAALTTLPWVFSNRHRDSDYRWSGPIIECGPDGTPTEIRFTSFLRAEPDMPEDKVETAYSAVRRFSAMAADPAFICRSRFDPGDLVIFNNRRILHGRDSFVQGAGARRLEGCYMETDELLSRLRVLARTTDA